MDETWDKHTDDYSTKSKKSEFDYISGRDEITLTETKAISTNTRNEINNYSINKPRRVIIKARIFND